MVMNTTTNYGLPAPAAGTPVADYDTEFATAIIAADAAIATAIASSPVNTQGGNYTLQASDAGKTIRVTAAATITVPASVFAVGKFINILTTTASLVTVVAGASATLVSRGSVFALAGQWAMAAIYCDATNHFVLSGDIA
jgi:hypothetical protein